MICIMRITHFSSLVSNSSIIKLSCRFSARHHPGQARDPLVVLLSPGTTTILVHIFSRRRQYIDSSSCHILYSDAIFSGLPPYFSSSNILSKMQFLCRLFITTYVFACFIFEYFNCKKRLLNYTMHKNIS